MDVETEKVIDLVFPEGILDSWKDNTDFYQYLSKLGSFDVDQLNNEPTHIAEEKNATSQSTQDLVFTNYKTFIKTAENSREIFKQFNVTEKRLTELVKQIPLFMEKCQSFCNASKEINTHRRLNSLTLAKNAELLEILEMPQLMESCLKSGHYNEALELAQYARQLGAKHNEIPIISSVVAEIENSWAGMVDQVVGSLKGDLPLPRCLQLVGLLRSMDAFTEAELRIKFLQVRDTWLQSFLNEIPKQDPNFHLTKTIELSRIHLFNIVTQYRAMFNDDDHISTNKDTTINECAIFYEWLEEKISQFLKTLEQDLPGVTSIDSILGQCIYFSLSFGRVGVDFTGRMSDIFVKAIREKFDNNVWSVTKKFERDMESFTLMKKVLKTDIKIDSTLKTENPPEQLIEFYPLAEYCNGLIAAFNDLRLCAPVAIAQNCTITLQESLQSVAKIMLFFYKREQEAYTKTEKEYMITFAECLSDQLIPYIQFCLHAVFAPNQIAQHIGIPVSQLQKENIIHLKQKKIIDPLSMLLPIKTIIKEPYLSNTTEVSSDRAATKEDNLDVMQDLNDGAEKLIISEKNSICLEENKE